MLNATAGSGSSSAAASAIGSSCWTLSEEASEEAAEEDPDPAGEASRTWPAWPGTFSLNATAGVGILLSRRISHWIALSEEVLEEALEEASEEAAEEAAE